MYQNKWKSVGILALSACLLAGCGNDGTTPSSTSNSSVSESTKGSEKNGDSTSGNSSGSEEVSSEEAVEATKAPEATKKPKTAKKEKATKAPKATKKPKVYIEKSVFKAEKEIYNDNLRSVMALGLKEYKQIKTEEYTDKPAKGNVYLVMFLDVRNRTEEAFYIHPDCVRAKINGKEVKTTYMYHSPEGYKTLFGDVEAYGAREGYIVWEVPKNWQKMQMTFNGFELLGGKRLKLSVLRKNLKTPAAPSRSSES